MAKVYDKFTGKWVRKGGREWRKARKREAEVIGQIDPGQLIKEIDRWERQQGIPYRTYPTARAELHRMARRQERFGGGGGLAGRRGAAEPAAPAYRPTGWSWYKPRAAVEEQPHLGVINRLLPYMAQEDVETLMGQLYTAGGGAGGPFRKYLGATPLPAYRPPTALGQPREGYKEAMKSISGILGGIKDDTGKAWAQTVWDVYRDWTKRGRMRTSEEEQVFKARLDELMASVPQGAEPYAAALQRLVVPTVRDPAREWYEMPAQQRTGRTNWAALGYRWNPAWM
jgi:hypothetical protein